MNTTLTPAYKGNCPLGGGCGTRSDLSAVLAFCSHEYPTADAKGLEVSITIPRVNERENLQLLVERLQEVMEEGRSRQVVVVDNPDLMPGP
ncbi:MAG: hypothetical protein ABSG91_08205 [Syntrophobacteraceae bacterium]